MWHWGDYFFINRFDIFLKFNCLISLFLTLLSQLESLGKLLRIFIFELNWKSAYEFQKSITKNSNVEFSRFLIIIDELNIWPNIISSMINGSLTVWRWGIQVFLEPLLRLKIILPTVIILQISWSTLFINLSCCKVNIRSGLQILLNWGFFWRWYIQRLRVSSHWLIKSLRATGWTFNSKLLLSCHIFYPFHVIGWLF